MLIEDVNQELLIEKLAERWAAEETAQQLYEHALACARRDGDAAMVARFETIQRQEREHAEMLAETLRRFGRDVTTEEIASIELVREETAGLLQVCARADVTLPILLNALLAAELIDVAGWDLLEELCAEATIDEDVVRGCRAAQRQEEQHLHYVKDALERLAIEELKEHAWT